MIKIDEKIVGYAVASQKPKKSRETRIQARRRWWQSG